MDTPPPGWRYWMLLDPDLDAGLLSTNFATIGHFTSNNQIYILNLYIYHGYYSNLRNRRRCHLQPVYHCVRRFTFCPALATMEYAPCKVFLFPSGSAAAPVLWTLDSSASILSPSLFSRQHILYHVPSVYSQRVGRSRRDLITNQHDALLFHLSSELYQ